MEERTRCLRLEWCACSPYEYVRSVVSGLTPIAWSELHARQDDPTPGGEIVAICGALQAEGKEIRAILPLAIARPRHIDPPLDRVRIERGGRRKHKTVWGVKAAGNHVCAISGAERRFHFERELIRYGNHWAPPRRRPTPWLRCKRTT